MHSQEVTVWCGFWAGDVIGPDYFENDIGEVIIINDEYFRSIVTDYFWAKLDMWTACGVVANATIKIQYQ